MSRLHNHLTKQLYGNRWTQYLLAIVIAVVTYTFTALIVNPDRFVQRISFIHIVAYCILAIITVEGNKVIAQFLDKRILWYQQPAKRFVIQVFLTVLWVTFILGIPTLTYIIYNKHLEYDYLLFLILAVTFGAILLISIHIGRSFFFNWQHSLIQNERLKQEKIQRDYEILQSQLNPHFLFNNLNVLIAQIRTDQDKAVQFVEHFADIYRYVLQSKDRKLASLEDELDFLESYRYLLQIRFGENLKVKIDIDESYLSCKIPPLTLQILMENAVKHNVISEVRPLEISINNQRDYLCFMNNIQLKNGVQDSTRLGLSSIKDRYAYFTDKPVVVKEDGRSFKVTIPLMKME